MIESIPTPRYDGKEIVIGIDSSKRNSAFTVGDMSRHVLDYYEFDGSQDGTTERDTLLLCQKQRDALKVIFANSKPKIVGIENIITKVTPGKRTGMTEHESRFKITAVFMSFIAFFQDTFDITPELINNWTWKTTVLPEQYCSKKYDKGSLAYFKDIGSPYRNCSDDVTDSVCILEYLYIKHGINARIKIRNAEVSRYEHAAVIVQKDRLLNYASTLFEYNKELTLEQNATVMSNAIDKCNVGVALVPTTWFSWEDIYKYCKGKFNSHEDEVKLVVQRKG